MLACELAAAMPRQVDRLVLIDPLGLWRDNLPVKNWMILPSDELRQRLFADPAGEAAKAFFTLPDERPARAEAQASFIWAQACTGKFVWPIPDRGLKRHIHRIVAPTLILWGRADGIIPADYVTEFASRIEGARVETLEGAGHLPHLEHPERVALLVREFLA
jgi:pimeloyl-ACP methyl ester carboxylesterase